jgi:hypothetical protein
VSKAVNTNIFTSRHAQILKISTCKFLLWVLPWLADHPLLCNNIARAPIVAFIWWALASHNASGEGIPECLNKTYLARMNHRFEAAVKL